MIRIGTRSSPLALIQAYMVRDALQLCYPSKKIDIIPFTTKGDKTDKSLADIGGKALFTKELQDALLTKKIDVAVHSLKDVENHKLPLTLAAFLPREEAHDVLIMRKNVDSSALIEKTDTHSFEGSLGSCSPRRRAIASLCWHSATCVDLRGNVGTRLRSVVDGKNDGTILAYAGLKRLDLIDLSFENAYPTLCMTPLTLDQFVPAAGQGIVSLECRAGEESIYAPINHLQTECCAYIERYIASAFGGNCRTALGVHAVFSGISGVTQTQDASGVVPNMHITLFFNNAYYKHCLAASAAPLVSRWWHDVKTDAELHAWIKRIKNACT